jgi:hypothetical protein
LRRICNIGGDVMNARQEHEAAGRQPHRNQDYQCHDHAAERGVAAFRANVPEHEEADYRQAQHEYRDHCRQQDGGNRIGHFQGSDAVQHQCHQCQEHGEAAESARPGRGNGVGADGTEGHGAARVSGRMERGMRDWLWLNSLAVHGCRGKRLTSAMLASDYSCGGQIRPDRFQVPKEIHDGR